MFTKIIESVFQDSYFPEDCTLGSADNKSNESRKRKTLDIPIFGEDDPVDHGPIIRELSTDDSVSEKEMTPCNIKVTFPITVTDGSPSDVPKTECVSKESSGKFQEVDGDDTSNVPAELLCNVIPTQDVNTEEVFRQTSATQPTAVVHKRKLSRKLSKLKGMLKRSWNAAKRFLRLKHENEKK